MNTCYVCSADNALYLTIKDGKQIELCFACVKKLKEDFWATQVSFE